MEDTDRLYDLKVLEPGSWPNNGAPPVELQPIDQIKVEDWVSGSDPRCGIVVTGGTAPERESVGIDIVRRLKNTMDPVGYAFVWTEWDFAENYRTLRSLEDFAKRERDPETWNLYVTYERKFHTLMGREIVFFQGLCENRSLFDYQREYLYNEIVRRLSQTQYDSPRFTVISVPDLDQLGGQFQTFYEYLCEYATVVSL